MRICHAVRGEGSELGILAQTQIPPQVRRGIVGVVGGRRGGGGMLKNCQWTEVNLLCILYTPLILLTGLITDCFPLVLIIWTCSFRTLLIKHNFKSSQLHIINRMKFMHIWRAIQGEGSKLGILARTQSSFKKPHSKGQPPDEYPPSPLHPKMSGGNLAGWRFREKHSLLTGRAHTNSDWSSSQSRVNGPYLPMDEE